MFLKITNIFIALMLEDGNAGSMDGGACCGYSRVIIDVVHH